MEVVMLLLGIDAGYSSVKTVLTDENLKVLKKQYNRHHGKIGEVFREQMENIEKDYRLGDIRYASMCGSSSGYLSEKLGIKKLNEVTATVEGVCQLNREIRSIIEIGGESAKYITDFSDECKTGIKISLNSNCASGTGSFLEEQVNRLNIDLKDYASFADRAKSIPRIAGRCSVFAKTDIIHHQQEGVSVEDILQGLSYSLVRNYQNAVIGRLPVNRPVVFTGGVSKNGSIIKALKTILSLNDEELIISDLSDSMAAYGCTVVALKNHFPFDAEGFSNALNKIVHERDEYISQSSYEPLKRFGMVDYSEKHLCTPLKKVEGVVNAYLGVDIGSTSTNLVLMDDKQNIVDFRYLRTRGNPSEVLKEALKEFGRKYRDSVVICGVGITGSGRYMIGKSIGADLIVDEITAQAKAAVKINPQVDTVFEIGGQDSKFIRIKKGVVTDFQMNKICAAGTGSFIEEQSIKFDIPVEQFGRLALEGEKPLDLGERCTVFIESSIASCLSRGAEITDIAAGLCYSIAKNYLDRVVGNREIGENICLQGGIAYNQGVVNAFRAITGKEVVVPEYFSITGAYGAALLSVEKVKEKLYTDFRGFFLEKNPTTQKMSDDKPDEIVNHFSEHSQKILFKDYDGTIDPDKKTVGIPRGLFTYGMYSMFSTVFRTLGFNVLLSDNTSEKTIKAAQQYSLDETCYPLKLINGHVADLIEKGVDYIFFPDLYSVDHPGSESRQNFGCPYMQLAFKMISKSMNLEANHIELLSPTMAFSFGQNFMLESFLKLGKQLNRNEEAIKRALQAGMNAFLDFEKRLEEESDRVMNEIEGEEKVFVIISKIYGAVDPVLNMGIPDKIEKMGYKVIPFYNMPEADLNTDYPNMYWPFGQHILEPTRTIKESKNLYAILLTHHGCGPDSVLAHHFMNEMGDKPYLHIEVDEHSSKVGVITRIEAFINSLNACQSMEEDKIKMDLCTFGSTVSFLEPETMFDCSTAGKKVVLPPLSPYSGLLSSFLKGKGIEAEVMETISQEAIDRGKQFMLAEEYFSTTALLGAVLTHVEKNGDKAGSKPIYVIPENEGAEVDGQYADFIRAKIKRVTHKAFEIYSPFLEDLIYSEDKEWMDMIINTLILGDLVRLSPSYHREAILSEVFEAIERKAVDWYWIKNITERVSALVDGLRDGKRVLTVGDPFLLFNDRMNNFNFRQLEQRNIRLIYTPLSEYYLMFWKDHADFNGKNGDENFKRNISTLKEKIELISEIMGENSNIDDDYPRLKGLADEHIGYYSGMNGRYRYAKVHSDALLTDGIITVSSMYENTGIMLNILKNDKLLSKPVLNLTFDGNKNENDRMKIESFIYYI